ncbi:MAG: DeoR/GlpR family DNA-binding transcription regulator [Actinobacteria bacterium]|nr:DeoR/GlpR family DNA-binding transcription regulator [Actinomycetota bacterium]
MRIPERRRIEIRKLIEKENIISVEKLSELFGISPITVRRDLEKLHRDGYLRKVHGGAVADRAYLEAEPIYLENIKLFKAEKEKIGKEAANRINDEDVIIIESGTTCLEVVHNLEDKRNLKIATAGIGIANELWRLASIKKDFEISVCGGIIRPQTYTYIGPHAVNFFKSINADIAFIGAVAVSLDKGIATATQFDAEITSSVIECSKKIVLLCDSSKFGKYSYINVAPLGKIDEIITDLKLDEDIKRSIGKLEVKLTVV